MALGALRPPLADLTRLTRAICRVRSWAGPATRRGWHTDCRRPGRSETLRWRRSRTRRRSTDAPPPGCLPNSSLLRCLRETCRSTRSCCPCRFFPKRCFCRSPCRRWQSPHLLRNLQASRHAYAFRSSARLPRRPERRRCCCMGSRCTGCPTTYSGRRAGAVRRIAGAPRGGWRRRRPGRPGYLRLRASHWFGRRTGRLVQTPRKAMRRTRPAVRRRPQRAQADDEKTGHGMDPARRERCGVKPSCCPPCVAPLRQNPCRVGHACEAMRWPPDNEIVA